MWALRSSVVVGAVLVGAAALVFTHRAPTTDLAGFPTLDGAELSGRTVVDFGYGANGVVSYSYLAAPVPESLDELELVELRNENSYTTLVAIDESVADPLLTLNTRFYSQPTFAKDVDGSWRYLEYATTTEQAFRARDMTLWKALTELVVRTAYADTLSPFSGAGDGAVSNSMSDNTGGASPPVCTWSTVRTAGTGNASSPSATSLSVGSSYDYQYEPLTIGTCTITISRGFLPFDTSSLSADATVSAASLSAYVTSVDNGDNDGNDYITVSTSTQATHSTLVDADYDTAGPLTMNTASEAVDSGQRKDITSISTNAYLTFTFNSAGITAVKKSGETATCSASTGITCIALREGHDANNDPVATAAFSVVSFSASETTGTAQDPYLTITYTAPASTVGPRGSLKLTGGGSLKIVGGGLKIR